MDTTPTAGRTYEVRTYGCQMNVHDSERISGLLEASGYARPAAGAQADVVVLNTCAVRENADNKLYGNLGHLASVKRGHAGMQIAVGGCLAQKDRDHIVSRAPWVDVVFGTHNLDSLPALLRRAEVAESAQVEIEESLRTFPSTLPSRRESAYAAWVAISVGCNNTCTFCIVPAVRGVEISRRPGDIVREVERLASEGVVEVTLLGQNVNTYGRDLAIDGRRRPIFADLLRRVGEIDGIRRIRFTSPHPADFREDVALAMAETPAVCEQLHLPLQSGSSRVLARMHRGYNVERFMSRLEIARSVVPDLTVSTDIIVGFPGETEDDFQGTLDVVGEARFDQAFMFLFSPRPGTEAALAVDDFVDPAVAQDRFDRLLELQSRISVESNREQLGRHFEVLAEGPSKKDPSVATTRTRGGRVVHVPGQFDPGSFFGVEINGAAKHHLLGSLT